MREYSIFDHDKLITYIQNNSLNTPCYIYDKKLLNDTFDNVVKALNKKFNKAEVHYAVKANHNSQIIDIAKKHNLGIDCVSGGEIERALYRNIDPKHIVFAGVGKADWEIKLAIDANIFAFNCESIQEVEVISQIATEKISK